jgi:adenosylcobinamide amidohydrolase
VTERGAADDVRLLSVLDGGRSWPALLWRAPPGWRAISSGVVGGGIGPVDAWFNAMVSSEYFEPDPAAHVRDLAARLGLRGRVAGMITAADVRLWQQAEDGGARVAATVGLGRPTLAAAPDEWWPDEPSPDEPSPDERSPGEPSPDERSPDERSPDGVPRVGTINLLVTVPAPLTDAALVNLVVTVTEAKAQAMADAGFDATGTASDAVCLACPSGGESRAQPGGVELFGGAVELYGGPRSRWGARVARAVHRSVLAGALEWRTTHDVP